MQTIIITLHIIISIALILIVLLQRGQEGMGAVFGGGSSSMFGSSGAGKFLIRVTSLLALVFLFTSLGYNILTKDTSSEGNLLESGKVIEAVEEPTVTFEDAPVKTVAPVAEPAKAVATPAETVDTKVQGEPAPVKNVEDTKK